MVEVMGYKYWASIAASIILGIILVTAGLGKLPSQGEFLDILIFQLLVPPIPPTLAFNIVYSLPWIELVCGSLLIIGVVTKLMASVSTVLIIGFIVNNSWMIATGRGRESCGCFGVLEDFFGTLAPTTTLYMDIGMLALALVILFYYPGKFFTARPWFLGKDKGAAK